MQDIPKLRYVKVLIQSLPHTHLYGTFSRQSYSFKRESGPFTFWFLNGPEN